MRSIQTYKDKVAETLFGPSTQKPAPQRGVAASEDPVPQEPSLQKSEAGTTPDDGAGTTTTQNPEEPTKSDAANTDTLTPDASNEDLLMRL